MYSRMRINLIAQFCSKIFVNIIDDYAEIYDDKGIYELLRKVILVLNDLLIS